MLLIEVCVDAMLVPIRMGTSMAAGKKNRNICRRVLQQKHELISQGTHEHKSDTFYICMNISFQLLQYIMKKNLCRIDSFVVQILVTSTKTNISLAPTCVVKNMP